MRIPFLIENYLDNGDSIEWLYAQDVSWVSADMQLHVDCWLSVICVIKQSGNVLVTDLGTHRIKSLNANATRVDCTTQLRQWENTQNSTEITLSHEKLYLIIENGCSMPIFLIFLKICVQNFNTNWKKKSILPNSSEDNSVKKEICPSRCFGTSKILSCFVSNAVRHYDVTNFESNRDYTTDQSRRQQ